MQWSCMMRRPEGWRPKPWDLVCSAHFREEDFDRTGQNTRLRENVVPSISKIPASLKRGDKCDSRLIKSQKQKSTAKSSKKRAASLVKDEVIDLTTDKRSKPRSTAPSSKKPAASPAKDQVVDLISDGRQKPQSAANGNKTPAASPAKDEAGAERMDVLSAERFHSYAAPSEDSFKEKWLYAESRAEELERNLHNALQREKRTKLTMSSLLEALKERNTVIADLQSKLDTYGDFPIQLFNKTNVYTTEQKNFAMTLHLYGPKAYQYLRQQVHMPSTRTLRRWLLDTDESAGLDSTVLHALKEKLSKDPSAFADVAPLPDAVSIHKDVTYDNKEKTSGSSSWTWTSDLD